MPIADYGVLKGTAVDRRLGTGQNPHYQVHLVDHENHYRIAINVQSKLAPSELEYLIVDHFSHPILEDLVSLDLGFHKLRSQPGGVALDYIRGNLFDPTKMIPLPFNVPGPDNDLNEVIDHYIQRAMSDENALIYAFGQSWGPESKMDKIFGFKPGRGIHDIHMNQGNDGQFQKDNGVYQDGGIFINFPDQKQWVAIFLKFQSQTWHTDDRTGDPLLIDVSGPPSDSTTGTSGRMDPLDLPTFDRPDGMVRIICALVNSKKSPEEEFVTLLNTSPMEIDLTGWMIADRNKNKQVLGGGIGPGKTLEIKIAPPVALSNKGGIISLLDSKGIRIHGVSYTKEQARNPGWTVVF